MIENLIRFWMAQKWKIVSPTGLQVSEPGCRGGVGEGSSLQLDRSIAARAFPPALPKHKRQHDINSPIAFPTRGLHWMHAVD